jgi:NAD(P)-dependent dehydrogenase (short-subunit alcohol dehydrogenase family)
MNIENKTVLITGANRGIGRALLQEPLSRGAQKGMQALAAHYNTLTYGRRRRDQICADRAGGQWDRHS